MKRLRSLIILAALLAGRCATSGRIIADMFSNTLLIQRYKNRTSPVRMSAPSVAIASPTQKIEDFLSV